MRKSNQKTNGKSTKEKILEAAHYLFLQKGIESVSVRDIALKAGINVALLNYHFQSKSNLFDTIFENLISEHAPRLANGLEDLPLERKIENYIDTYTELLIETPQLVVFVLSAMNKQPEKITQMKIFHQLYNVELFENSLKEAAEKGQIQNIEATQFFLSLLSLITFPFAIRHVIMQNQQLDHVGFANYMRNRKTLISQTIIQSIRKPLD